MERARNIKDDIYDNLKQNFEIPLMKEVVKDVAREQLFASKFAGSMETFPRLEILRGALDCSFDIMSWDDMDEIRNIRHHASEIGAKRHII